MRLQAPLAALPFVGFTAAAALSSTNCSAAAFQKIIDANGTQARVEWATYVPAGGSLNPLNYTSATQYPTGLPESCAVQVNVASEGNSSYLVGVIFPSDWNGRMLSAAAGGGINWVDMGTGTHYGFAAVSSNLGHVGIDTAGTWAIGRPEAVIDWGYRAWHGTTLLAKLLVAGHYSSSGPKYSYFYGCSTGGRQSMKNMQEYPDDYDGIIAGAPAWWTTHQQLWNLKQTTYQAPANSSHTIPETMFSVLAAEVLKQCDPQDGLTDTIISNPQGCVFNPLTLACNATSDPSTCLTADQLTTLASIYSDWIDTNQTFVYSHVFLGSESSWLEGNIGLGESSTIDQQYWFIRDLMGLGDSFVWQDLDFETVELADKLNPGNATAGQYDISAFADRGGKFIHYHGLSDSYVSPGASVHYYDRASSAVKPKGVEVDDFYRLFLIPGMEHCFNTPTDMNAPWYIAGADQASAINTSTWSVPGYKDAKHDVILAMMAWVENGTAPEELVATVWKNISTADEVSRQRPVCKYPLQAKYTGHGDPDESANWGCEGLY
ncbi:tannase and feruloyl esterase [Aspergillus sclerotiicarbonarius CBS 121057]|uniref:Carboxylic ester hydrolase n=1 Tax=Aspergillus sclerotiicarbonarius (strain CBS 121057 / IBT 28362) TaxID=1448318 RepID=A0A319EUD2_ASPSB|nr:tannase and feruloyl esterase [Aspergillus sclerotiicarbonarius CBS 121057]